MSGLRAFLLFNELSQVELADFLGISRGQMSKLVSGNADIKTTEIYAKIVDKKKIEAVNLIPKIG